MSKLGQLPVELVASLSAVLIALVAYPLLGPGCACLLLPFVVAIVGYSLFRLWSQRKLESAVATGIAAGQEDSGSGVAIGSTVPMDGATCLRASNASVVIRKRTWRNWVLLIFLGLFALGFGATAAATLLTGRSPVTGESLGSLDLLGLLCLLSSLTTALGVPILVLVRAMLKPSIHVDANSKMLEIGRGSSARKIPFSSISDVVIEPAERLYEKGAFAIVVVLERGERVRLGTVSGVRAEALARAGLVAQWVAETTGVSRGQQLPGQAEGEESC